jgi:hypothetical protein
MNDTLLTLSQQPLYMSKDTFQKCLRIVFLWIAALDKTKIIYETAWPTSAWTKISGTRVY